ncbi:MAG: hypothetical protein JO036_07155 [Candidatus Eremiobacteraeota bacterium]|nr:hypothetical protein [Candidatus Eremiobacteraeota bacterium]
MLVEGLGLQLRPNERLQRETDFSVSSAAGKANEDPAYYATRASRGAERLVEMLEESAFWSSQLMRHSKTFTTIMFGILGLVTIAAIVGLVPVAMPTRLSAVRAIAAAFSVVVVADMFGALISFDRAQRRLDQLLLRLDAVTKRDALSPEIVAVLTEYNSTVEGAPMFPPGIYERHQECINRLWAERRSRTKSRSHASA